jgi:hypothetical protein
MYLVNIYKYYVLIKTKSVIKLSKQLQLLFLFLAVSFYKVTANTKLANTKQHLLGEKQDWVPVSLYSEYCQ